MSNGFHIDDLRYPIGLYVAPEEVTESNMNKWIEELAHFPQNLREVVASISSQDLNEPYRPGSWTIRQLIHHIADSHINAYVRFKLALTEETPTIRPYHQDRWATLPDSIATSREVSLQLLEAVHRRWVNMLILLTPEDYNRTFYHPEQDKVITLRVALGQYVWHGNHHLAQIQSVKDRNGWK